MISNEYFKEIYDRYYKLVYKIAYEMCSDITLSEDICQEVFLKLYQTFEKPDDELIKAWLVLNTRRKAIDYHRKSFRMHEVCSVEENLVRRESPFGLPDACPSQMLYADLQKRIFERLKVRNETWYNLIVHIVIMGEKPEQVAKELNMTMVHLRTTLHRARVWIRKEFGVDYKNIKY